MVKRAGACLALLLSACAAPRVSGHPLTEPEAAAWNIDISSGNGGAPPGNG